MEDMLTQGQLDKLLDNPNKCPKCDSDDLDSSSKESDENYVRAIVTCSNCGVAWREIYTLAVIENI